MTSQMFQKPKNNANIRPLNISRHFLEQIKQYTEIKIPPKQSEFVFESSLFREHKEMS